MHGLVVPAVSSPAFGAPSRWLITKRGGRWRVRPPVGTFWGRSTEHDTGDQALADYRHQTSHTRG
ncbi:hypothetical protein SEA_NIKLAS_64 [Mycobacterium Phage Niklas]|uniref:Uncharacterized protein n=1 Tax=Mycobacterium Phage Niklas TaxID=2517936 RepID=A0A482JJC4_9CAUD|nr:hypothetical protein I5H04_gp39 [Mycobacterium Phage Niklas]ASR85948.1 hypothetical protein SEA_PEANAM_64 [Mycobacterium phage Peanam]QAY02795.1 hypothetical protein SEA_SHAOBING_64 [Mycobacterium phage Shaobing]QBP31646.1 hypothetical protein SEA_NIKLAS_64 [Mycobacterium Phage Niklas]